MIKNAIFLSCAFLCIVSLDATEMGLSPGIPNAHLQQSGYSWTARTSVPDGAKVRPVSIDGKFEKDGVTSMILRFGDRSIEGYVIGNKAYVTSPDVRWDNVREMEKGEHPGRFMERMVRGVVLPARQLAELAASAGPLRQDAETNSADLSETSVKALIQSRAPGAKPIPAVMNASGSVKYWLEDGAVSKYEFTVRGNATIDGKDVDLTRTTTIEIKDVGSTHVVLPDRARERLGIK